MCFFFVLFKMLVTVFCCGVPFSSSGGQLLFDRRWGFFPQSLDAAFLRVEECQFCGSDETPDSIFRPSESNCVCQPVRTVHHFVFL